MTILDQLDTIVRALSPTHAPILWIFLNGACCLAAALVFFLATAKEKLDETTQASYVLYNLLVCLVWFTEISLFIRYPEDDEADKSNKNGDHPEQQAASATEYCDQRCASWEQWIEFAVASYFLVDCVVMAYRWHLAEILAWHVYVDTVLDFVIYVYYLAYLIQAQMRRHASQQKNNDEDVSCSSSAMMQKMEAGEATGDYVKAGDGNTGLSSNKGNNGGSALEIV